jgi:hypothetical protein
MTDLERCREEKTRYARYYEDAIREYTAITEKMLDRIKWLEMEVLRLLRIIEQAERR